MLISLLEQSLAFLPLTLAIYISYGILRIPDLATDGSFILGAALFGICIHVSIHPIFAMIIASLGGAFVGITTSFLQTRLNLNPLIAGILLVFILNTISLKIMGKPNLSLIGYPSIFDLYSKTIVLLALGSILLLVCAYILMSPLGLLLHAFGNNPILLNLSGKNAGVYRMIGLSFSNALVGGCGALTAQINGYADIGMGTGVVLIALATVIIGQQISKSSVKRFSFSVFFQLFSCFVGIIVYFSMMNFLIRLGLDPIYLRLMVGVCLIAFLSVTKANISRVIA